MKTIIYQSRLFANMRKLYMAGYQKSQ